MAIGGPYEGRHRSRRVRSASRRGRRTPRASALTPPAPGQQFSPVTWRGAVAAVSVVGASTATAVASANLGMLAVPSTAGIVAAGWPSGSRCGGRKPAWTTRPTRSSNWPPSSRMHCAVALVASPRLAGLRPKAGSRCQLDSVPTGSPAVHRGPRRAAQALANLIGRRSSRRPPGSLPGCSQFVPSSGYRFARHGAWHAVPRWFARNKDRRQHLARHGSVLPTTASRLPTRQARMIISAEAALGDSQLLTWR